MQFAVVALFAAVVTLITGLAVPADADDPWFPAYYVCVEGKPPYPVFVESAEDEAAIANLRQGPFPNTAGGCLGIHSLWNDVPDPRMAEALWRVGSGTWDQSDINYIKTDPEIAAQVPDPSQPIEFVAEEGVDPASSGTTAAAALAGCSSWVKVWFRRRSTLGFTTYKYFNKVYYCRSGGKITAWGQRYDYWENPDVVAYWREQTLNRKGGLGTTEAWSRIQRHVELCVTKFGCYANFYPWIEIRVKGNGDFSYSGHS